MEKLLLKTSMTLPTKMGATIDKALVVLLWPLSNISETPPWFQRLPVKIELFLLLAHTLTGQKPNQC